MNGPASDDSVDERDTDGRSDRSPSQSDDPLDRSSGELEQQSADVDEPRRDRPGDDSGRSVPSDDGFVTWALKSDNETALLVRDVLTSVAIVALIGLVLFGISGIWPPLVAVESGSMEPNMERGDLIFVVGPDRFSGNEPVDGTGVVTADTGTNSGHEKFSKPGDVIIFSPDGNPYHTPVIHRAHFYVESGENWVETSANPAYVGGASCAEIDSCPAQHDGFITKGDANRGYDQIAGIGTNTDVVKPEWVNSKAMVRIPWLGHVRLVFDELLSSQPTTVSDQSTIHSNQAPTSAYQSSSFSGHSSGLVEGGTGSEASDGNTPPTVEGADQTSSSSHSLPITLQIGLVSLASIIALVGARRPGHF